MIEIPQTSHGWFYRLDFCVSLHEFHNIQKLLCLSQNWLQEEFQEEKRQPQSIFILPKSVIVGYISHYILIKYYSDHNYIFVLFSA